MPQKIICPKTNPKETVAIFERIKMTTSKFAKNQSNSLKYNDKYNKKNYRDWVSHIAFEKDNTIFKLKKTSKLY